MNKNTIGYKKGSWLIKEKKIMFYVEGAFLYYKDEEKPWVEIEKICVEDSEIDISDIIDDEVFQKIVNGIKHLESAEFSSDFTVVGKIYYEK